MELPNVSLGELYSLLGEKDVYIYQQGKVITSLEEQLQTPKVEEKNKKDPFKKG
jgi:hypothetical protein